METSFPKQAKTYFRTENFQDQEITLTYVGWIKKANEDRPARGNTAASTWKQNLKFCLRYSYPEFAVDEVGEKILGKDGNPWRNRNFDPAYPHGYTVVYKFEEGELDSGSLPLFKAFCMVQPSPGDRLVIGKTGRDKETKWRVKKVNKDHTVSAQSHQEVPDIDFNAPEFSGDVEINPENGLPF